MKKENLKATLEAVLFTYGEPLSFKELSKITGEEIKKVEETLKELADDYKKEDKGLCLIFKDDKVLLSTKPDFGKIIEKIIKDEFDKDLTPASLETLAIISYLAPVSRAEIDYIRGVNSSFILRSLVLRGLIERKTDPKRPYAFIYQPAFDLIKYLGIEKIEDLPEYQKYRKILEDFNSELNKEAEHENK